MAHTTRQIQVRSNGQVVLAQPVQPPGPPQPVPEPMGWLVTEGDGNKPARVKHDSIMRDTGMNLQQTNEMFAVRPYDGLKVDWRSKIVVKLSERMAWPSWMIEIMGSWLWSKFTLKGFGWMDFDDNPELRMNVLECGGNTVNVMVLVGNSSYGLIETQSFFSPPDKMLNYKNSPHLFIKQVLVGKSSTVNPYWVIDRGHGDLYIPLVTNTQAAMPLSSLEFFPALPLCGEIDGYSLFVDAYKFSGSNVYVRSGGLWYLAEEMLIFGDNDHYWMGGSYLDRRQYFSTPEWPKGTPAPISGGTRQS